MRYVRSLLLILFSSVARSVWLHYASHFSAGLKCVLLPKDTSMSVTLPYEPCFSRTRIVAKCGHSLLHGRLSIFVSAEPLGRFS
jgi:hypothetical protein